MRRISVGLTCLLLSGALGLAAQTLVPSQHNQSFGVAGVDGMNSNAAAHPANSGLPPRMGFNTCPINMQALQGTGRGLLLARDNKGPDKAPPDQPAQRIHLILADGSGRHIVRARVTARGFGSRAHMEHTLTHSMEPKIVSLTLEVRMHATEKGTTAGDLILPGFTTVQTIELFALRFDDGSSWSELLQTPCSVTPDPLMLIADR
jgi:hypothetical protein